MATINYDVFAGYTQPEHVVQNLATTTINENITSKPVVDPDTGETKTGYYIGVQTVIVNDAIMEELANTTSEQDELIAELLEAQE